MQNKAPRSLNLELISLIAIVALIAIPAIAQRIAGPTSSMIMGETLTHDMLA